MSAEQRLPEGPEDERQRPGGPSSFAEIGVTPFFIERLGEHSIVNPTAIQSLVIPPLLEGKSILFRSATGTGKTFAYLLPLFQRLLEADARGPLMLICAPTHELCAQIKGEADFLLAGTPLKAGLLIGSANLGRQAEELKKRAPQVIAGNPGRLLQLARMGKLKLQGIRFLVLDEGDRLTSDESLEETRSLAGLVKARRLTVSCSATAPVKSRERLFALMGEGAVFLEKDEPGILRERIAHWALFSEERRKIRTLRSFIAAARPAKILVFTGLGAQVGNIVSQLQFHGISAGGLFSGMDKRQRKQALDDFRRGRILALATSDLAARGLDIPGVSHVAALDVPQTGDAYVHRAGRTGRAGKAGVMLTIGDEEELRRLAALEKKLGIVIYPKELWGGRLQAPS